ncbi:hypothetical protein QOZ95_004760 [Paenibacillus brasilensis]|uniref:Uncharacterized protein n=1 Tax=Paenibacillus brasilensis TaxID=128574 RepID=A0ABU0L5K6_9BACL|nr:hypothetical protein [Paenibacillus brasilensis]
MGGLHLGLSSPLQLPVWIKLISITSLLQMAQIPRSKHYLPDKLIWREAIHVSYVICLTGI